VHQVTAFKALSKIKAALVPLGLYDLLLSLKIDLVFKKKLFSEIYDDSIDSITTPLDGIKITIPRAFVGKYIRQDYEPISRKAFLDSLGAGMVVVDVGAHIGYYSLIAAKRVTSSGTVHAIEPSRNNARWLDHNVASNNFKNIKVHYFAAGVKHEKRLFHITNSSDCNGFYVNPIAETINTIETDVVPIDEIVSGPVHVVKIDVEGAEIEVLCGMKRILEENPQLTLFLEWNPGCMRSAGRDPLELPSFLKECGFSDIGVLDDAERRIRRFEEVYETVQSGNTAEFWHVNLYARRLRR